MDFHRDHRYHSHQGMLYQEDECDDRDDDDEEEEKKEEKEEEGTREARIAAFEAACVMGERAIDTTRIADTRIRRSWTL